MPGARREREYCASILGVLCLPQTSCLIRPAAGEDDQEDDQVRGSLGEEKMLMKERAGD